jgi:hypothetical protein
MQTCLQRLSLRRLGFPRLRLECGCWLLRCQFVRQEGGHFGNNIHGGEGNSLLYRAECAARRSGAGTLASGQAGRAADAGYFAGSCRLNDLVQAGILGLIGLASMKRKIPFLCGSTRRLGRDVSIGSRSPDLLQRFVMLKWRSAELRQWRAGGTGRRRRLKIVRPQGHGGSSPSPATITINSSGDLRLSSRHSG